MAISESLIGYIFTVIFAIIAGYLGLKRKNYRDAFYEIGKAVRDSDVTWDEARSILEALEEEYGFEVPDELIDKAKYELEEGS